MKRGNNGNGPKGEQCKKSDLTAEKIKEIRRKYKPYSYTLKMLSSEYGVSIVSIFNIIHEYNWRHI